MVELASSIPPPHTTSVLICRARSQQPLLDLRGMDVGGR